MSGVWHEISSVCVSEDQSIVARIGDRILVHIGFVMSRADEQEFTATLKIVVEPSERDLRLELEIDAMQLAKLT